MKAKIAINKLDALPKEMSGYNDDIIFVDVEFPEVDGHRYLLEFKAPLTKTKLVDEVKALADKVSRRQLLKQAATALINQEFAGLEIDTEKD